MVCGVFVCCFCVITCFPNTKNVECAVCVFSVFTILAALLHLGNVTLVERSADMTGVEVKNMAQLKVVSDLLKVWISRWLVVKGNWS